MKRIPKLLADSKTLIDLAFDPGWDNDYENFEQRQKGIRQLRGLIEAEQVFLHVPSILISSIHTIIQMEYGIGQATQVVQKILRLSSHIMEIDVEQVLEKTTALLLNSEEDLDFYEGVIFPYASVLQADAIIVRHPHHLRHISELVQSKSLDCSVPVLDLETALSFISERREVDGEKTIFVMTPKHQVIRLPKDATPVDFAYKVHSELGDRCERAFVNGQEVPLNTKLHTGSVVVIAEGDRLYPDSEWLNFVKTRVARRKIKQGLKRLKLNKGWEKISNFIGSGDKFCRYRVEHVAQRLGLTTNQLVIKVEAGYIDRHSLQSLVAEYSFTSPNSQPISKNISLNLGDMLLDGRSCKLASCCLPFPQDEIMGVLGKNDETLRIHHSVCQNLGGITPSQQYPLSWGMQSYGVELSLLLVDKPDTLRPLLNRLVDSYEILPDVRSVARDKVGKAWVVIKLSVGSKQYLSNVIHQIETVPEIQTVKMSKVPLFSLFDGAVIGEEAASISLRKLDK